MTNLNKQHFYKAGARLARTSCMTRRQAGIYASENTLPLWQTDAMMRGFDNERALIKSHGLMRRIGARLGATPSC